MITHLTLKNFVVFTDLSIDFSPGINIIIGENGTGKTQLLKAILALCGPEARAENAGDSTWRADGVFAAAAHMARAHQHTDQRFRTRAH